jgi:hypothetical protein
MDRKTITILTLALAFLGGFFFFYSSGSVKQKIPSINQAIQQTDTKQKLEPKIDEQASVTVIITPIDISPQSKEWKFDVVINTHSVELDQDMTKVSILVDDNGKEYKPLRWEGGEAGGHHREGVLIFNEVASNIKSVELKISGIGGVDRNFIWKF